LPGPSSEEDRTFTLKVHLVSTDPAVQMIRLPPPSGGKLEGSETTLCTPPCGKPIVMRTSDLFYLGGPGMIPSEAFNFRPHDGEVHLNVKAGYKQARVVGDVGAGLVYGGAIVGLLTFALAYVAAPEIGDPGTILSIAILAGVLEGVGLIMSVASLPFARRTTFTISDRAEQPPSRPAPSACERDSDCRPGWCFEGLCRGQ